MSLYVIADLHLSTLDSTNKSMEVFGRRWDGYMTRIKNNWERLVTDEDTVVIPGDVSWALSLEEAVSDLKFIDALPGKKITFILKRIPFGGKTSFGDPLDLTAPVFVLKFDSPGVSVLFLISRHMLTSYAIPP